MHEPRLTRQQQYRRDTMAQIKASAMAQMHKGGPAAVSLSAIARSMAMSAPALYRYVDSRDELLAELAVDVHLALAGTLRAAATRGSSPAAHVEAVATAYRDWALAQPNAYRLAHGSIHGSGVRHAGDRIAAAAQQSMDVLLEVVAEAGLAAPAPVIPALDDQLRQWNRRGGQRLLSVAVLQFGLIWWSRLHGLVSLELSRHVAATGIDPELLYRTEIQAMLGGLHPDAAIPGRADRVGSPHPR
ncbi:TetR/AcrR family transcriptional regulator [Actinoplanes sp. NPDC049265]|uniref:TetR/AcrR family transcriptional regulator n=1 Tax=Actinoplanes sp. NPDC049265 TaxID=3363902 RepID=UPI0037233EBA